LYAGDESQAKSIHFMPMRIQYYSKSLPVISSFPEDLLWNELKGGKFDYITNVQLFKAD
jgi:hypothetical protein